MRRKAKDRDAFWYEFPHSPYPGDDYFWDDDNQQWRYIEDDMDMSWVWDCLHGKDANPDKKVKSLDDENSGKKWKEAMKMNIEGKTWKEHKEVLKKKGFLK